ncbi:hypothetical protein DERP_009950 [Dermatophagoides pteronyssinus]|uniref:Uncharacterized protein n=1 Tax=Dermatophagoides pteronyssinus TaxID=6956 RepID=A0ABQ8J206_DERPT|nr:hypothetical protein DERP_009950 [Dermatophagoides pteronyssinus]
MVLVTILGFDGLQIYDDDFHRNVPKQHRENFSEKFSKSLGIFGKYITHFLHTVTPIKSVSFNASRNNCAQNGSR